MTAHQLDEIDEATAKAFHESYERLAPEFGYETRRRSAVPWDEVPEDNRMLMMAVVHDLRTAGKIIPVLDTRD